MAEIRKKGWHPDPFGTHHERYYFADDEPGRLVRDQYLQESFDDIPGDLLHIESPDPAMFGMLPIREPVVPLLSDRDQPALSQSGPVDDDDLVVDGDVGGEPMAIPPSDDEWIDPPTKGWTHAYHDLKMPSRRVLVAAGGGVVALIAIIALVITLGSSSPGGGGSQHGVRALSQRSSDTLPPANGNSSSTPSTAVQTAWEVTSTYDGPSAELNGVSCPTDSVCLAAGQSQPKTGFMLRSGDGGTAWTEAPLPTGTGPLTAISCPVVSTCVAVGGTAAVATTSSGLQWSAVHVGSGSLTTVTCTSASACVAGGSTPSKSGCADGSVYITTDAGQHWKSMPQHCFTPTSIACPSSSRCEAVGFTSDGSNQFGEILASRDGGAHWQLQMKLSDAGSAMSGVTCQSASVCEAVGASRSEPILGTLNGGATWTGQTLPSGDGGVRLAAVGCGSLLVCQAVGSGGQFSTKDGGHTWARQDAPTTVGALKAISCPTADLCAAVAISTDNSGSATLKLPL
jgi:photosystem II stability/assembly factor-like uncharacterized protein